MDNLKYSLKKLATIVAVIFLVLVFLSAIVSLSGTGAHLSGLELQKTGLKEAEKLLSSDDSTVTLDGYTYEKTEFQQKLEEDKQAIGREMFTFRMIGVASIVVAIMSAGCLFLIAAWPLRCKQCKKWFAMQKRDTVRTQTENIYMVVENKTRSAYDGKVTAVTEQHIPGKRITYRTTHVCKHCGAEKYKYHTVDTPNT